MAPLEGGREVEIGGLLPNRLDDPRAGVAGVAAPQARGAIDDPLPVLHRVVHAVGPREQALGSSLKSRLAVNGIQKASRLFGAVASSLVSIGALRQARAPSSAGLDARSQRERAGGIPDQAR